MNIRSKPKNDGRLKNKKINVFVKVDDDDLVNIVVNKNESVSSVLESLSQRRSIPKSSLKLMNGGRYLEENWTMGDCELENKSVMHLMHGLKGGMQIFVKNIEGKIYTIEVTLQDTVAHLKNKIYEKSSFPPDEQRLVFRGSSLKDEQTLQAVGLQSNSEINLVIRQSGSIKVLCKVDCCKVVEASVQLLDTVDDLKKEIASLAGMSTKGMEVIFLKGTLKGADSLKECGLENGSQVDVITKKSTNIVFIILLGLAVLILAFELKRWYN